MAVPSERPWTNMLAGRSPTCKFPRDDPGRTCSTDGPHQQVPAEFPQVLVGRSPTCKFARNEAGRTCSPEDRQPASSRGAKLDVHARRKVATWKFPRNDAGRT
uniref:(northern house mosquito) hypothetical protein n=1 Tax=Culex pipiens TaxID=7175 RepID=A0A8D8GUE1_CULPI